MALEVAQRNPLTQERQAGEGATAIQYLRYQGQREVEACLMLLQAVLCHLVA